MKEGTEGEYAFLALEKTGFHRFPLIMKNLAFRNIPSIEILSSNESTALIQREDVM